MAAYVKYNDFVHQLCLGVHNLDTHVINAMIHSDAPTEPTDVGAANLTPVTGTGYAVIDILGSVDETSTPGTAKFISGLASTDAVWTAGGAWATGRYVSLYNDTATSPADALICSWDYGGAGFTLASGETFTLDMAATIFGLT